MPKNTAEAKHRIRLTGARVTTYVILLGLGIAFLYPILFMITTSFKSTEDLVNPTIEWIPSGFYTDNYVKAFEVLDFNNTFFVTLFLAGISTVLQTISCALAGYGFARHSFRGKGVLMVLLLMTFVIPSQVTLVPKYLIFHSLKLIGSPMASFLPAVLGQGFKSAIFILVFTEFFSAYPKSFDEAARMDGAGRFKVFLRIALPVCVPAIIVSLLFSFVWYWNETYLSSLLQGGMWRTLPMKLQSFVSDFSQIYTSAKNSDQNKINESLRMAATILTILPLIIVYLLLQKQFIEGIESSGLTGE